MGTCQSRAANSDGASDEYGSMVVKPVRLDGSTMLLLPEQKSNLVSLLSPSEKTNATAPETPTYQSTSQNTNLSSISPSPKEASSDRYSTSESQSTKPVDGDSAFSQSVSCESRSVNRLIMDSIISDKDSLGVPGTSGDILSPPIVLKTASTGSKDEWKKMESIQEEDNSMIPPANTGFASGSLVSNTKNAQNGAEDTARMSSMRYQLTTPGSIVFRPAPLIAPPKSTNGDLAATLVGQSKKAQTSVTPQTIANFNRLKIQVQLAEKNEMHRRRKAKLEDRFEDVKGYRNLWKDFESLKEQVKEVIISRNDELDTGKIGEKSIDLNEPTSWYFDFQSLQLHQHVDGEEDNNDNRSQASMSLLSEATMEVQRQYYDEKRRMKKNGNRTKPKKNRIGASDDRSVASARSTTSRGSNAYRRGKTDELKGDYGPMRDSDVCTIDASYIGSDDSTPRTRTGRTIADDMSRTTFHDDAASFVSELDWDNDYNVRRRRRHRQNFADDSSLDTFDDRSLEGFVLSAIEFDMTDFQPRLRDEATLGEEHHGPAFEPTEMQSKIQHSARYCSAPSYRNSPASRIEHYGFDPSAPLSSQLEIFAQSLPSVEIDNAETGLVRWRKFSDTDENQSPSPRRLEVIFGIEENELTQPMSQMPPWGQASGDTSKLADLQDDCPNQPKASQGPEQTKDGENIPKNIEIVSIALDGSAVQSCTNFSYNAFDVMSPSQFLMMSSSHAQMCIGDVEEEEVLRDETNSQLQQVPGYDDVESTEAKEVQESQSTSFPIFDPIVSVMSTEDFLQMSSWYSQSLIHTEIDPNSTNIINQRVAIEELFDDAAVETTEFPQKDMDVLSQSTSRHKLESREEKSEGDLARTSLSMRKPQLDDDCDDISSQVVEAVDFLLKKFRNSN